MTASAGRTGRDRVLQRGEEIADLLVAHAEGDLVGGLRRGIQMLAEHARAPQTLHAQQP